MNYYRVFYIPKVQLVLLLLLISFSTLLYYPLSTVVRIVSFSVLFSVVLDLLFTYLRKHILFVPYAAIATGLILGLTINPRLPWYGIFLISLIASGSKYYLRVSNRQIFNPAAMGLVVGNILLQDTVSWWGVSFQILKFSPVHIVLFGILLLPFLVSGIRMKRFSTIFAFMGMYSLLVFLQSHTPSFTMVTDPSVLFFAITMLPEPMTSPVIWQRQIVYGAFVAIATLVATNILPDGLLPFLLLGNLIFFRFR